MEKILVYWDWTCLNNDTVLAALAGNFVPGPDGCALKAGTLKTGNQVQPPTNLNAVVN